MFSLFFIKRPRFAIVIAIILALAGMICLFNLPVDLYPTVTPPEIRLRASYPGASADTIAKTIGIPLEDGINGVDDMIYMSSTSSDGYYMLTITFAPDTDPDMATVKVGEVNHPMLDAHYIEWIMLQTNFGNQRKVLKPGDEPKADFALLPGEKVVRAIEFCNLHGLYACE